MTMRQVSGLLKVINKAELIQFYNGVLSYGVVHGAKLPSLDEFLNASLNKPSEKETQFDSDTDKFLEAEAFKRLHERRSLNG